MKEHRVKSLDSLLYLPDSVLDQFEMSEDEKDLLIGSVSVFFFSKEPMSCNDVCSFVSF